MKILVVDDEKLLVKGIKFNLENEGYQVETCYDGAEAVEKAAAENFDLIILDLMMPKMNGLEACMHIREKSMVPIIMLTAPKWNISPYYASRRDIIRANYERAVARGDQNVYFIDGETLFSICKKDGTVDDTHPTDLGFFSMAEAIAPVLEKLL